MEQLRAVLRQVRKRPATVLALIAAVGINAFAIGLIGGMTVAVALFSVGALLVLAESTKAADSDEQLTADALTWGGILAGGALAGIGAFYGMQSAADRVGGLVGPSVRVRVPYEAKLLIALSAGLLVFALFGSWRWPKFALPTLQEYEGKWLARAASLGVLFGLLALIALPFVPPKPDSAVRACQVPLDVFGKATDVASRGTFLTAILGAAVYLPLWLGTRGLKRQSSSPPAA